VWRPFSLKASQLAASPTTNFKINVIDWNKIGAHSPIGHIIITPQVQLCSWVFDPSTIRVGDACLQRFVQAINSKEALKISHHKVLNREAPPVQPFHSLSHLTPCKGKAKDVGSLSLAGSSAVPIPRFIDYLIGGLEMRMFVAVDFTSSNGHPRDPKSLHHMRPGHFNE
jgi:hypothetical protein